MTCIKGVNRSAFDPDAPYMAGAVDLQFSSSVTLEIFKLDFQPEDREIPVVGESITSEWCNRLSWGKFSPGSEDFSLGLIDGGPVDGH